MSEAELPTVTTPPSPSPSSSAPRPLDFAGLEDLAARTASTCTLVIRGGEVVHEYLTDSRALTRRVYSITKSVVAVLAMIAAENGLLVLDAPVARYVDGWPEASDDVTVRHLLSMTSGRHWTEALDQQMIGTADQTATTLAVGQQDRPGTRWRYDNLAAQVLSPVLTAAVGDIEGFARDRLFEPLGLRDTTWERDGAGQIKTYAGIVSSCRDVARLGMLLRDGGRFDGRRLLSATAVSELTTASSDLNAAYGLLWWTNAEGSITEVRRAAGFTDDRPPYEGRLAPAAPEDTFWALGWGNQLLAVVPSADVVAVRLGPKPEGPEILTFDTFTSAVLAPFQ